MVASDPLRPTLRSRHPIFRQPLANPLVRSSYLQMAKAVASSIGLWCVLDAYTGHAGPVAASLQVRERWHQRRFALGRLQLARGPVSAGASDWLDRAGDRPWAKR